jgi:sortase A
MALYRYVKTYPSRFRLPFWIPFGFIGLGALLLLWVTWPIMTFKLASGDFFARTISPVTDSVDTIARNMPQVVAAAAGNTKAKPKANFNNPDSWFPAKPQTKVVTPVNGYSITIPQLPIKDPTVIIAGDDLHAGRFPFVGTALPGADGPTVIFGHSTLPQLYDPKNYHTIFSLLPTLKAATDDKSGDEIYLTYDGVTYRYQIYDMVVTKPDDLTGLEQKYDSSYLTLITCVPPGTYWERLDVKAKLVPYQ